MDTRPNQRQPYLLRTAFHRRTGRLPLYARHSERIGKREPCEAVEIGALRTYDRPQPTTRNYDQLLENYPSSGVIQ